CPLPAAYCPLPTALLEFYRSTLSPWTALGSLGHNAQICQRSGHDRVAARLKFTVPLSILVPWRFF
ncbi:MAG: hypothetical protein AAGC54_14060, partial [Cyanobacteria bacterium P01_F01_bin.4]